ncbi:hypothetical protein SEA_TIPSYTHETREX_16 [Mycobacterium phage TipsytheTRex]|nr:hypothetical protein SEA_TIPSYTHETREX_16 [Mycobacterium phage TipsytheTRex]
MRIQSTVTGGFADVSDEYAQRLIKGGSWRLPPKRRAPKPKTKPAPEEEPKNEE